MEESVNEFGAKESKRERERETHLSPSTSSRSLADVSDIGDLESSAGVSVASRVGDVLREGKGKGEVSDPFFAEVEDMEA